MESIKFDSAMKGFGITVKDHHVARVGSIEPASSNEGVSVVTASALGLLPVVTTLQVTTCLENHPDYVRLGTPADLYEIARRNNHQRAVIVALGRGSLLGGGQRMALLLLTNPRTGEREVRFGNARHDARWASDTGFIVVRRTNGHGV